jgi:hypothetical protein
MNPVVGLVGNLSKAGRKSCRIRTERRVELFDPSDPLRFAGKCLLRHAKPCASAS